MDSGRGRTPLHGLCFVVYAFPEASSLPELWRSVLRRVLERVGSAAQVRVNQGGPRLSGVLRTRGWRLSWVLELNCVEVFCVFLFFFS